MSLLSLSIVTINYHSTKLINNIELLVKNMRQVELIVVDNSGNFKPINMKTKIVCGQGNVGFGTGCNLGAECANSDLLLFLNPDTSIESSSITQLVSKSSLNMKAIWAPAILDKIGKSRTLVKPGRFGLEYRRTYLDGLNNSLDVVPVHYVSGACMMVCKSVFDELGGFCEDIFLYAEDLEFCERAKTKGVDILVYADIKADHVGGKSSSLISDRFKRLGRSFTGHYHFLSQSLNPLSAAINALYLASGIRM